MESLFKLIEKTYEHFIKGDVTLLFFIVISIFVIYMFKFIYSNRLSYKEKTSSQLQNAFQSHLNVKHQIYLFKNTEITKSKLIESLNSLAIYMDRSFLDLIHKFSYEDSLDKSLNQIEDMINTNINILQYNNRYHNINTDNLSALDYIENFFKSHNISTLFESLFITLISLLVFLEFIRFAIIIYSYDNLYTKLYLAFSCVLILFWIIICFNSISYSIKKNKYKNTIFSIIINLLTFLFLNFLINLECVSKNYLLKFIILVLLSSLIIVITFLLTYKDIPKFKKYKKAK